jgi:hypothetical protein
MDLNLGPREQTDASCCVDGVNFQVLSRQSFRGEPVGDAEPMTVGVRFTFW